MRPDVGTQAQFKKKLPPKKYRYDDSLSPSLEWDGQNAAREQGEALIKEILDASSIEQAKAAASKLKAMSKPFLNWAGKAERFSFEVPTLPLFIHERLSTKAILETLKGHRRDKQINMFDLFGDPQHPIHEQVLRAYEHKDKWVNRMILGDSLVVMNSLLQYEGLGGQVQMIYIDPPYGVKFGSNFQPFVRRRDVGHGDDEDMTREPEMVQAYRDTWERGVHSYLSYLRDRVLLARDLLTSGGSIFVQISDDNLHHVRELLDEVFGPENFISVITIRKTASEGAEHIGATTDFLLFYARDAEKLKFHPLFVRRTAEAEDRYDQILLADGTSRSATPEEREGNIPKGARLYQLSAMTSSRPAGEGDVREFHFQGMRFTPGTGTFKTNVAGLQRLADENRLEATSGGTLRYRRFADDFPFTRINNFWADISGAVQSRSDPKIYAVQTSTSIVERCVLMTTDPGDLVLDPTCGSGTTAYVAENWGRRWIAIDTSRVPLALARQRLLTATYTWYELIDETRGPAGGFVYEPIKTSQNPKHLGPGIVRHVMLETIANNEPPKEEVLVDRPEIVRAITRVTGPFTLEATIPTPVDWKGDGIEDSDVSQETYGSFVERMLEVLRKSPVLRLEGNKTVTLKNVRPPTKTLSLSAEAIVANGGDKPVAFVFGPENGAVSEKLVYEAAKEANAKNYSHLYVVGFSIQPHARTLIDKCAEAVGVPATYVQATPDLMMGDLLKNMRSSQIFSVCGLPEVALRKIKAKDESDTQEYEVELLGLDVFDPVNMEAQHRGGDDVPAWFLDTDYNNLSFT